MLLHDKSNSFVLFFALFLFSHGPFYTVLYAFTSYYGSFSRASGSRLRCKRVAITT